MNLAAKTAFIKQEARRLGFDSCGISKSVFLEEEAPRLEKWLNQGMHGSMGYMANHFDKRLNPGLLVDGAKSVISLLLNYYPEKQQGIGAAKISKYAFGTDYHMVIKDKLKELSASMREKLGAIKGRAFVDSAPVLDRAWAKKAGLGWIGKNANLITKKSGSFFFIAELIVDIELEYDHPTSDHCGSCTRCIDACPTDAIVSPSVVDGSRCISYFTIELKESLPAGLAANMDNWLFGCDICQDVCPWNRFSKATLEPAFKAKDEILNMSLQDWTEITTEVFGKIFDKSALKRKGLAGIQNTALVLQSHFRGNQNGTSTGSAAEKEN